MDLNKTELIGRLTADPERREIKKGVPIAALRVATGGHGKEGTQTVLHAVTMYGRLAEVATKYLKKGDRIYVDGRLEKFEYTAKGVHREKVHIVARNLIMLGGKPQPKPQGGNDDVVVEEVDDGKGEV